MRCTRLSLRFAQPSNNKEDLMANVRATHPKVAAAGVSGAAATVIVWVCAQLGLEVPGEVGAAIATLLAFAGGWAKGA